MDVTIQSCYINGKTCRNGKRDDFDVNANTGEKNFCNKWVKLIGVDPQTGASIDYWMCGEQAKIKLLVENSQMTRWVQSSVDKTATEVRKQHVNFLKALPDEARSRIVASTKQISNETV